MSITTCHVLYVRSSSHRKVGQVNRLPPIILTARQYERWTAYRIEPLMASRVVVEHEPRRHSRMDGEVSGDVIHRSRHRAPLFVNETSVL